MTNTTTLRTRRELFATPAEVFAAIRNPVRLARWWGPDGFTNRFATFDFVPGGDWVFSMIGPDGKVYPNASIFTAIEPDRRVVIRHVSPPNFVLTMTLEASDDGTLITWEQEFADPALAESLRPVCEPANEQNLDRLTAEVLG